MGDNRYGCCPVPNAVCCIDQKHCCPSGYTCDFSTGTCEGYGSSIPMLTKRPLTDYTTRTVNAPLAKEQHQVATNKPQNIMCDDKKTSCADGDTCCKLPHGKDSEYGCCPMSSATCCSDGIHCCPSTYTCNVSGEMCSKPGSTDVPLMKKVQALRRELQNVICSDGKTECPSGDTCCQIKPGLYACCPVANAVCCKDGNHCCPSGYTCNTEAGTCTKGSQVIAMFKKQPAIKKAKQSVIPLKAPQNVECPDQKSECASNNTCCLLKSGLYGCCPLPFAVCCKDGIHCCPNDYACQQGTGMCTDRDSSTIAVLKMQLAVQKKKTHTLITLEKNKNVPDSSLISIIGKSQVVTCPDGNSICPDGYTCCRNASGGYGCCPHLKAICCDDSKHCCPEDYTCDPKSGSCVNGDSVLPLSKKISATSQAPQNVMCPDEKTQCFSNNTCCQLESGSYSCCPAVNAVCCADRVHCCPSGTTCDLIGRKCRENEPFTKLSATNETPQNIICPDEQNECMNNQTCCLLKTGDYGCCPTTNAVCCEGGVYCCPTGTTCDIAGQQCKASDSSVSLLKLFEKPSAAVAIHRVQQPLQYNYCPDGSYCLSTETCCEMSWGDYGCCPEFNGVCCSDDKHCCPAGTYCDLYSSKCIHYTESSIPPSKKQLLRTSTRAGTLRSFTHICPNGKDECSDNSTCCPLSSGQYGCCPVQKAICCPDNVHCCPQGYTCDTDAGTCSYKSSVIPILRHTDLQKTTEKKLKSVICPDNRSECPSGTTCCALPTGGFGCCPILNAECCTDGEHCCPKDYKCDVSAGKCMKGDHAIAMFKKLPAIKSNQVTVKKLKNVPCPDGRSECPDQNTCCKLQSGDFGCCPLVYAVCCSDGKTCCPSGYECDDNDNKCTKGKDTVIRALLTKLQPQPPSSPSSISEPQNRIPCPQNHRYYCESGHRCCPTATSSSVYECCPIASYTAVCCEGQNACCPQGYTCNKDSKNCIPNIDLASRYPFLKPKLLAFTATKQHGVMKSALVPPSVKQSTIEILSNKLALLKKQSPIIKLKVPQNVICPDQKSECSSNSTCCLLKSGEYGCCPVPKARCCKDGEHCCPESYSCHPGTGTCVKGDQVIAMVKKQPAIMKSTAPRTGSVTCPDNKSTCPDKTTCCKLKSGQFGCCPQVNGVCCSDDVHCCPTGFTCNIKEGTCTKGGTIAIPFLAKLAVATIKSPEKVIKCPDNSYCQDTNTCCQLEAGNYGCCPQVHAVCCSDKEHCCPQNYTCELTSKHCTKGNTVVPMLKKLPSFSSPRDAIVQKKEPLVYEPQNVICPDQRSQCPTDNTCCLTAGAYRCCPGTDAVCCGDRIHCCPKGFTCHVPTKMCTKGDTVVPMLKKSPTIRSSLKKVEKVSEPNKKDLSHILSPLNVICPGQKLQCPDDNTCCPAAPNDYNCCPTPDAVCCQGSNHCCPKGYTCNATTKTCSNMETGVVIPFMEATASTATKDDVIEMTRDVL